MAGKVLTEAQRRELELLGGADRPLHYSDSYKPIQRLLALGYVDRREGKYGSTTWTITPAGRRALSEGGQT